MRKKVRLPQITKAVYVLALWMCIAWPASSGPVRVSPLSQEFNSKPGSAIPFTFTVTALAPTQNTPFKVTLTHTEPAVEGGFTFTATKTYSRSCADWITLKNTEFVVPMGEEANFDGVINIPLDAQTGTYVGFLMIEPLEEADKQGVTVLVRYAIRYQVTVQGRQSKNSKLEVESLKIDYQENPFFVARIKNSGNTRIDIDAGDFDIIQAETKRRISQGTFFEPDPEGKEAVAIKVYPESAVELKKELTRPLPPGDYMLTFRGKYGKTRGLNQSVRYTVENLLSPESIIANDTRGMRHSIEPRFLEDEYQPGFFRQRSIRVENYETEPMEFAASLEEIKGISPECSCFPWLTLRNDKVTARPGSGADISMSIQVPNEAQPGGYYALARLQAQSIKDVTAEPALVLIKLLVPGENIPEKIIATTMEVAPPKLDHEEISIMLKNIGRLAMEPKGTVVIINEKNNPMGSNNLVFNEKFLFPGQESRFTATFNGNIPSGTFTILTQATGSDKRFLYIRKAEDMPPGAPAPTAEAAAGKVENATGTP